MSEHCIVQTRTHESTGGSGHTRLRNRSHAACVYGVRVMMYVRAVASWCMCDAMPMRECVRACGHASRAHVSVSARATLHAGASEHAHGAQEFVHAIVCVSAHTFAEACGRCDPAGSRTRARNSSWGSAWGWRTSVQDLACVSVGGRWQRVSQVSFKTAGLLYNAPLICDFGCPNISLYIAYTF